jgi:dihydroxyacetone kinase-like protein
VSRDAPIPARTGIRSPGEAGAGDGDAVRWIRLAAERVAARRGWLTDLDAAVGDGDHGINLDRGFRAAILRLDEGELRGAPTAELLSATGRWITGTVGGASGALYGRAFMHAGAAIGSAPVGATRLERAALALEAAVDGIVALGRARPGEKTMVDALVPAAAALRAAASSGRELSDGLDAAAAAAEAGADSTVPLLATKGRASYLGERSIGHLDPGAVSSALLLRALADVVAGAPDEVARR